MIYVITHKIFNDIIIDRNYYQVLHVGTNDNSREWYLRDDQGNNNISRKNSSYCELTGMYWIWKNANEKSNELVGLIHYRRFFTTYIEDFLYTYFNKMPRILDYSIIENALSKYDIILPARVKIFRTVKEFYGDLHSVDDLDIARKAIEKVSPEYLNSFDEVMNKHYFYYANILLCKKKLFDDYSTWLFKVMQEIENNIDLKKYADTYQSRVFGFISERLLQVWVSYNQLSIKEYPVFNTEQRRITIFQKNVNRFNKLKNKIMRNI